MANPFLEALIPGSAQRRRDAMNFNLGMYDRQIAQDNFDRKQDFAERQYDEGADARAALLKGQNLSNTQREIENTAANILLEQTNNKNLYANLRNIGGPDAEKFIASFRQGVFPLEMLSTPGFEPFASEFLDNKHIQKFFGGKLTGIIDLNDALSRRQDGQGGDPNYDPVYALNIQRPDGAGLTEGFATDGGQTDGKDRNDRVHTFSRQGLQSALNAALSNLQVDSGMPNRYDQQALVNQINAGTAASNALTQTTQDRLLKLLEGGGDLLNDFSNNGAGTGTGTGTALGSIPKNVSAYDVNAGYDVDAGYDNTISAIPSQDLSNIYGDGQGASPLGLGNVPGRVIDNVMRTNARQKMLDSFNQLSPNDQIIANQAEATNVDMSNMNADEYTVHQERLGDTGFGSLPYNQRINRVNYDPMLPPDAKERIVGQMADARFSPNQAQALGEIDNSTTQTAGDSATTVPVATNMSVTANNERGETVDPAGFVELPPSAGSTDQSSVMPPLAVNTATQGLGNVFTNNPAVRQALDTNNKNQQAGLALLAAAVGGGRRTAPIELGTLQALQNLQRDKALSETQLNNIVAYGALDSQKATDATNLLARGQALTTGAGTQNTGLAKNINTQITNLIKNQEDNARMLAVKQLEIAQKNLKLTEDQKREMRKDTTTFFLDTLPRLIKNEGQKLNETLAAINQSSNRIFSDQRGMGEEQLIDMVENVIMNVPTGKFSTDAVAQSKHINAVLDGMKAIAQYEAGGDSPEDKVGLFMDKYLPLPMKIRQNIKSLTRGSQNLQDTNLSTYLAMGISDLPVDQFVHYAMEPLQKIAGNSMDGTDIMVFSAVFNQMKKLNPVSELGGVFNNTSSNEQWANMAINYISNNNLLEGRTKSQFLELIASGQLNNLQK